MTMMTIWSLRTGRPVPGFPPNRLTEEELITFWSDDALQGPATSADPVARLLDRHRSGS